MKNSHIHDAIGELSEEILLPVEKLRQKKGQHWMKWAAMAACVALVLGCLPLAMGGLATKSESLVSDSVNHYPAELEKEENYGAVMDEGKYASFRAKVLKVYENSVLVEPLEGEREENSSDRFEISLGNLEDIPQIQTGDIVEILYDGFIQETYPCRITGTISVTMIE